MSKVPLLIISVLLSINSIAKSPHGDKFTIECNACHNSKDWTIRLDSVTFDHSKTEFPLIGKHLVHDKTFISMIIKDKC